MQPNHSETVPDLDSDEWETVSESDSIDRPLPKNEMHRLTEVPMHLMTESDSLKWFAPVLNYRHENKCYELIMVNIKLQLHNMTVLES